MIIKTKVNIDLQRPAHPVVINAVQGDQNSRCLEVALYSGGTAWQVPEDIAVAMRYCKPDKTKGYYDSMPDGSSAWTAAGNTISILLAPQMLTVAGPVFSQLEMIRGSALLATYSIQVNVAANPAAGILVSEDYVNWLQWMEDELETKMNAALANGDFTGPAGPKGDPGEPATLVSKSVTYQVGESEKVEPTGEWSTTIPSVAQGKYLWSRQVIQFNTGDPITTYSVARFGIDGAGSVSSVAGVSPDDAGNVPLTASNVGALPTTGGTMEGSINMNGQIINGLNAPTEDDEAATKGYVDATAKEYAESMGKAKAGFIYPLASAVVPDGFLLCDGAEYSRTDYPELFAAIGTTYGEGDGDTTFNVPNLATRVPVGAGDGYDIGETGGEENHTLTDGEMPSHFHEGLSWGEPYGVPITGNLGGTAGHLLSITWNSGADTSPIFSGTSGGSQPHNNMQPYTVVNYIIATGKATGVSVSDIVLGAQAIPLPLEYGGHGATNAADARKNLGITSENIGALSMELLWENASPTSEFAEQTLAINTQDYQLFIVETSKSAADRELNYIVFKGRATELQNVENNNNRRRYCRIDDAGAYFGVGEYAAHGTTDWYQLNKLAVPNRIYGIKGVL